mmetsp:Transcript_12216/g.21436  ORF Transcript_12216/g.21436 Transcript_12216/m.21436 type:complete len:89 (-) Transcript_12216:208-474(-)
MTGAGKVVGEEEGKGVAATREEELAQKHIKEMVALASGKAEKKVLIQVAKEVPSSGGADADAAPDGGASASTRMGMPTRRATCRRKDK